VPCFQPQLSDVASGYDVTDSECHVSELVLSECEENRRRGRANYLSMIANELDHCVRNG